jgi:hypothetical protein
VVRRAETMGEQTELLVEHVGTWAVDMLVALRGEAESVAMQYVCDHMKVKEGKYVRLVPRVRLRREPDAPPGSFVVEWVIRYPALTEAGSAKRKLLSKYIPRGAGDRYTPGALAKHAKDWQLPLVEAAEDYLAPIRRQVRAVIELRRRVREYAKLEAALRGTGATGDEDEEGWA